MVDAVEGTIEVNRGDRYHMSTINTSRDPFDSIDQGVLRGMTLSVSIL